MDDSQEYKPIPDGYQRFPNLYQRTAWHAQNKSAKALGGPGECACTRGKEPKRPRGAGDLS